MSIYLPQRWRRQPQGAVQVDWNNSLTRNLRVSIRGNGITNDADNTLLSQKYGLVARTATMAGYIGLSTNPLIVEPYKGTGTTHTLFVYGLNALSGSSDVFITLDTNLVAYNIGWTSDVRFYANAAVTNVTSAINQFAPNTMYAVAARFSESAGISLFGKSLNNGGSLLGSSGPYTATGTAGFSEVALYGGFRQKPALGCVWDRALSDAEINTLLVNPYQLFKPQKQATYFLPSLANSLSEPLPDTTNYIQAMQSGAVSEIDLQPIEKPAVNTNLELGIKTQLLDSAKLQVELLEVPRETWVARLPQRKYMQQPQGKVEIDWNNPLTNGLYIATLGTNESVNLTNKTQLIKNRQSITNQRFSKNNSLQTKSQYWLSTSRNASKTAPTTIVTGLSFFNYTGSGFSNGIASHRFGSSGWVLGYSNRMLDFTLLNQISYSAFIPTVAEYGKALNCAVTYSPFIGNSSGTVKFWKEGQIVGENATGLYYDDANLACFLGNEFNLPPELGYLYWYERILSDNEIKALHENPYQIFKPQQRRIYSLPGKTDPKLLQVGKFLQPNYRQQHPGFDRFQPNNTRYTNGLEFLYLFGINQYASLKNLVNNKYYTGSGTGTYGVDRFGTYYEVTSAATRLNLTGFDSVDSYTYSGNYSMFITFTRTGTVPAWSAIVGLYDSGSNRQQGLQRDSTNLQIRVRQNNISRTVSYDISTVPLDTQQTIVVTNDGTTTKVYYPGSKTPATAAQTSLGLYTLSTIELGGWSSGEFYPARYRAFGRWKRTLSDAEALAIVENPYQLFKPRKQIAYTYGETKQAQPLQVGTFLPQRWRQQPQGVVQVDWSNPLARGLKAAFDLRTVRDLVTQTGPSLDTASTVVNQQGVGKTFPGTTTTQFAHRSNYALTGPMTAFVLADINTLSNYTPFISKENAPSTNVAYEFRCGVSNATGSELVIVEATAAGQYAIWHSPMFTVSDGFRGSVAFTRDSGIVNGGNRNFFVNGKKFSGTLAFSNGSTSIGDDGASAVIFGSRVDAVTRLDGRVYLANLWDRVLSDSEIATLSENPWQLFKPQTKHLYSFPTLSENVLKSTDITQPTQDRVIITPQEYNQTRWWPLNPRVRLTSK